MYFDLNINYDSSTKSLESYSDFCELISSAIAGKIHIKIQITTKSLASTLIEEEYLQVQT